MVTWKEKDPNLPSILVHSVLWGDKYLEANAEQQITNDFIEK